jgi:hypothetical protein
LADDELKKFFHRSQRLTTNPPSHKATAWQVDTNFLGLIFEIRGLKILGVFANRADLFPIGR